MRLQEGSVLWLEERSGLLLYLLMLLLLEHTKRIRGCVLRDKEARRLRLHLRGDLHLWLGEWLGGIERRAGHHGHLHLMHLLGKWIMHRMLLKIRGRWASCLRVEHGLLLLLYS